MTAVVSVTSGFSYNGDIEHNQILFNQSTNPTIASNGGGIVIMGAPDADPPCSALNDADCVGAPNLIGPSDGTGPNLVINANLIMGNAAESGSGGGIRFQAVNGSEVVAFPTTPSRWYSPTVTNNVIVNNVAGWDGAGISLLDSLAVNIINNTIESNDTTASSGVLFNTLGAPLASAGGPTCTANCGTTSAPQPAGLVSDPKQRGPRCELTRDSDLPSEPRKRGDGCRRPDQRVLPGLLGPAAWLTM